MRAAKLGMQGESLHGKELATLSHGYQHQMTTAVGSHPMDGAGNRAPVYEMHHLRNDVELVTGLMHLEDEMWRMS